LSVCAGLPPDLRLLPPPPPPPPLLLLLLLLRLQEYLSVFTPLLLEEAVEGVRSSFEEAERKGKGAAGRLTT
jgi:hypothetical protein